jgi:hypothetical protein
MEPASRTRDHLAETAGSEAVLRSGDDQPTAAAFCILALLAAVVALSFLSGGYILQRTAPIVFVLAALGMVAVWRARALSRPSRPYLVALIAFAAFVAWTGLSVLWSTGPDLSWVSFVVAVLYLLVMAAVGLLPGGPLQLRLAAYGFAVVVLVVSAYAFLGKIAPDMVEDAHLFARLRAPIGYWNVLAVLIVMALPILLEIASRSGTRPLVRGFAASALVLLSFTFFFTFSRGGYVALAAALLVYFALTTRRLNALTSLAIPMGIVAAILLGLRHLDSLFAVTADDVLRATQGHTLAWWFVVALGVAFALQFAVTLAERRWALSAHQARVVGLAVLAVLVVVPLVFGTVSVVRHGGGEWLGAQYHALLSPAGPSNDVDRLTSLGTSGRVPWYREALRGFSHHVVAGTGAGTFRLTNELYRTNDFIVLHSHSQWLNVLTELGIVGLILFAVAVGGLVVAAFGRVLRDRRDPHRALLAACQAAVIAFVVHISIDWDWDMTAITVAFLLLAGVSAAYVSRQGVVGQRRRAARAGAGPVRRQAPPTATSVPSRGLRLLATAVILFAVACWALPYLAERATATAQDQLSRGQLAQAEAAARRAAALDPLAVDPLLTLAAAQAQNGDPEAAAATLEQAVRLQPDNYEPYYQMGNLQLRSFGDETAAREWYRKALELNPRHPGTRHMLGQL